MKEKRKTGGNKIPEGRRNTEYLYKRRRIESAEEDLILLGEWIKKAEERCWRSENFRKCLEKDRARTIRRMVTYKIELILVDLPVWWTRMEGRAVPTQFEMERGARHPINQPTSRSTQLDVATCVNHKYWPRVVKNCN